MLPLVSQTGVLLSCLQICNSLRVGHFVAGSSENAAIIETVASAQSPEEAARLGRRHQRSQPAAVRLDWDQAKLQVMLAAVRAKVLHFPSLPLHVASE